VFLASDGVEISEAAKDMGSVAEIEGRLTIPQPLESVTHLLDPAGY